MAQKLNEKQLLVYGYAVSLLIEAGLLGKTLNKTLAAIERSQINGGFLEFAKSLKSLARAQEYSSHLKKEGASFYSQFYYIFKVIEKEEWHHGSALLKKFIESHAPVKTTLRGRSQKQELTQLFYYSMQAGMSTVHFFKEYQDYKRQ